MPKLQYFIVQQIREVKVAANSPGGAGKIAEDAFKGTVSEEAEGRVVGQIRDLDLLVRSDR